MFTGLKQRILLGIYIFILISIPVGAFLASQATQTKSQASESKVTKPVTKLPKPSLNPAETFINTPGVSKPTSAPEVSTATSYGPTLSLKILIDGRPMSNQATKLFVGIVTGTNLQSPQYLLSFTVDMPASGQFDNISLAGLTVGNTYTAILKGDAQIATSSAFVMNPAVTNLNSGVALAMLSGDLNQDNVINNLDLQIVQAALGQTSSPADLNKDGIVNGIDLAILNKNLNKVGATGTWVSPPPKVATPSGSLAVDQAPPTGSPTGSGYWVWVPK